MEDGQSTGFFKMHQLGAGRDYNTWRRYFMANAELKDFADVLLEGPAAKSFKQDISKVLQFRVC